eukprot:13581679-Heterocapsa_arctica.AAC.1
MGLRLEQTSGCPERRIAPLGPYPSSAMVAALACILLDPRPSFWRASGSVRSSGCARITRGLYSGQIAVSGRTNKQT